MSTATHSHLKLIFTDKIDTVDYVLDTGTSGDECRVPIDHPIPDSASFVIADVAWAQEFATKSRLEF
jgi:hypothetical protein